MELILDSKVLPVAIRLPLRESIELPVAKKSRSTWPEKVNILLERVLPVVDKLDIVFDISVSFEII